LRNARVPNIRRPGTGAVYDTRVIFESSHNFEPVFPRKRLFAALSIVEATERAAWLHLEEDIEYFAYWKKLAFRDV